MQQNSYWWISPRTHCSPPHVGIIWLRHDPLPSCPSKWQQAATRQGPDNIRTYCGKSHWALWDPQGGRRISCPFLSFNGTWVKYSLANCLDFLLIGHSTWYRVASITKNSSNRGTGLASNSHASPALSESSKESREKLESELDNYISKSEWADLSSEPTLLESDKLSRPMFNSILCLRKRRDCWRSETRGIAPLGRRLHAWTESRDDIVNVSKLQIVQQNSRPSIQELQSQL